MSDQNGKTPEDILADMREAATAAFSGQPVPELEAPESDESVKPTEVPAEAKAEAKQEEPAKEGEPETPKPAPEESKIPDKYQGKSQEDLIKMLEDGQSYFGKLGSERAHEREETEKLRAELDSIKDSLSQKKNQDQESSLREGLEGDDPAKTMIDYIDQKFGSVENKVAQDKQNRQAEEAGTYYRALLDNPDFSRRKEHVDKVAEALQPYVKPEYVKSKDFVEICDLISKGTDIDYYIQRTKTEAADQKEADLNEKREAQTVSGSSSSQSGSSTSSETTEADRREAAMAAFAKQGR